MFAEYDEMCSTFKLNLILLKRRILKIVKNCKKNFLVQFAKICNVYILYAHVDA